MKIGEAHWTQSSSLYSANTIGTTMNSAPIGVADRTRKKLIGALCLVSFAYWRRGTSERQYIGAPMPPTPFVLAHKKRNTLQVHRVNRVLGFLSSRPNWDPPHPLNRRWVCPFGTRGDTLAYRIGGGWGPNTRGQTLWYSTYISCTLISFISPIGGPNISVRLAYFHPNRLLTGLYKQEMEILWKKDDGNIKKQTDIDRHSPEPSLNSSQPPDPPHFSLPTTF